MPSCPKLTQWAHSESSNPKWIDVSHYGSIGTHWVHLGQLGPLWVHWVHVGQLGTLWAYWVHLGLESVTPVDILLRFALHPNLFLLGGGLGAEPQPGSRGGAPGPWCGGRKFLKINANLGTGINRENVLSRNTSYRTQNF